jgi:hypothetical protein
MTVQLLHSEFPYEENLIFFFISAGPVIDHAATRYFQEAVTGRPGDLLRDALG